MFCYFIVSSFLYTYLTYPFLGGKSLCGTERDINICSPFGPVSSQLRCNTKSLGLSGGGHCTKKRNRNKEK